MACPALEWQWFYRKPQPANTHATPTRHLAQLGMFEGLGGRELSTCSDRLYKVGTIISSLGVKLSTAEMFDNWPKARFLSASGQGLEAKECSSFSGEEGALPLARRAGPWGFLTAAGHPHSSATSLPSSAWRGLDDPWKPGHLSVRRATQAPFS